MSKISYRQKMGLDNPSAGTDLNLRYMEGLKWYLHWGKCPDKENIVQGWFSTAEKARKYAKENNWIVKYEVL